MGPAISLRRRRDHTSPKQNRLRAPLSRKLSYNNLSRKATCFSPISRPGRLEPAGTAVPAGSLAQTAFTAAVEKTPQACARGENPANIGVARFKSCCRPSACRAK